MLPTVVSLGRRCSKQGHLRAVSSAHLTKQDSAAVDKKQVAPKEIDLSAIVIERSARPSTHLTSESPGRVRHGTSADGVGPPAIGAQLDTGSTK